MSDTPRMNASAHDDGAIWQTGCDLERELNAANERIKRLEEAGDEMEKYIHDQTNTRFIICAIRWREAKELKL